MNTITLPFELSNSDIKLIDSRLEEFKSLNEANNIAWFSELCFCILTANAQAQRAINIQKHLGDTGFLEKTETELAQIIKDHGHRFHNNKAKYIVSAREHTNIKDVLVGKTGIEAREFLAKNIKGIGYKESSHFLRNVGFSDVAIIDRHILRFLYNSQLIESIPKTITPKKYLEIEDILKQFNMPLDKLDLLIWCWVTGKVLK